MTNDPPGRNVLIRRTPEGASEPDLVRVSLPRSTWAAVVAVLAVPVLALILQLMVVEDQRRTIRDQRALTDRLLSEAAAAREDATPLLRKTPPLVDGLAEALPAARATGRRLDALGKAATPLAQKLASPEVADVLSEAARLAADLRDADVGSAIRVGGVVSAQLLDQDRLQRLLVRTVAVLGEVRARDLVPKAARAAELTPELVRIQRSTIGILRSSLAVQRDTLDVARQPLEVARDTNGHAESLDRKFGGQVPPPGR